MEYSLRLVALPAGSKTKPPPVCASGGWGKLFILLYPIRGGAFITTPTTTTRTTTGCTEQTVFKRAGLVEIMRIFSVNFRMMRTIVDAKKKIKPFADRVICVAGGENPCL